MEVSDDHPDLVEMGLSLLGYFNSSAVPPQWPQIDERSNPQCRIITISRKMKNFSEKKVKISMEKSSFSCLSGTSGQI